MSNSLPIIAITSGEPAGIGLDICAMLAHQAINANLAIFADINALLARAQLLNIQINITPYNPTNKLQHLGNGTLVVQHVPLKNKAIAVEAGQLDASNSPAVLDMLTQAAHGCVSGEFSAMVTAPVHKGIINDAGIAFSGHTEFLAELTNSPQVVMMLVGGGMRVALATTHLPLNAISHAITQTHLENTIRILHADLVQKFGLSHPRILVAGLNPHAGEGCYLGMEEFNTINPVLNKLSLEGMNLIGALPADTMFSQSNLATTDAFLAMYHDQGLPVLKHASFGTGVNVTLGLPIIRTSVDHGTALDLAGKRGVEIGSMLAAIELAIELSQERCHKKRCPKTAATIKAV